jgi:hypothetical protein
MYKRTLMYKFPNVKPVFVYAAAAGIARCISIFDMYPVDTIKVRYDSSLSKCDGIYLTSTSAGGACLGNEETFRYRGLLSW